MASKMKTKIRKRYIYEGLGYPIVLRGVTMIFFEDEWHPKINVKEVAKAEIKRLCEIQKLTEKQLSFVWSFFSIPKCI